MRVFTTFEELAAAVGEDLGTTDWLEVTQERVDAFAEATGDHQWIHVDVERAAAGPFGGTIAHGYLTLALVPHFNAELFALETPGRPAQLRRQQGALPQPGQGRLADPGHTSQVVVARRRSRRQAAGHCATPWRSRASRSRPASPRRWPCCCR